MCKDSFIVYERIPTVKVFSVARCVDIFGYNLGKGAARLLSEGRWLHLPGSTNTVLNEVSTSFLIDKGKAYLLLRIVLQGEPLPSSTAHLFNYFQGRALHVLMMANAAKYALVHLRMKPVFASPIDSTGEYECSVLQHMDSLQEVRRS